MIFYILLSVLIVSLISLIGILLLGISNKKLNSIIHILVSFAAGSMLGGAFFHILPESVEQLPELIPFVFVIFGFILFFILEKILHWRHCHNNKCEVHSIAYLNFFGDAIHNFIDGVAIAASYFINISTGIATTIAILIHEIPQELGDFGILIHSGLSKKKALFYNFLSALTAIIGAVLTFIFAQYLDFIIVYLMPIVAGGFIYMAGTDLLPELHKEKRLKKSAMQFIFMLLGLLLMYLFKVFFE